MERSNEALNRMFFMHEADPSIFAQAMHDLRFRSRFQKVIKFRDFLVNEAIVNNLDLGQAARSNMLNNELDVVENAY